MILAIAKWWLIASVSAAALWAFLGYRAKSRRAQVPRSARVPAQRTRKD